MLLFIEEKSSIDEVPQGQAAGLPALMLYVK